LRLKEVEQLARLATKVANVTVLVELPFTSKRYRFLGNIFGSLVAILVKINSIMRSLRSWNAAARPSSADKICRRQFMSD